MNKKTIYIIIGIIACFVIGFIAGQEYTKYQIREGVKEAFQGIGEAFSNLDNDKKDTKEETKVEEKNTNDEKGNTIKDKDEKKETKKSKEISIKKGETKTISGKYDGDKVEVELSLWDVAFNEEILPPEPRQSFYSYYSKKDNKTYATLYLNVKNLGGKNFDLDYVLGNKFENGCRPTAVFGGKYEYTADIISELKKDAKGAYTYDGTFIYIDPLESKELIVAFNVPNEVKDKDAKINLCVGTKKVLVDLSEEKEEEEEEIVPIVTEDLTSEEFGKVGEVETVND